MDVSSEDPGDKPLRPAAEDTRFFGHPGGLSTLFFSEMWERFSFYGMRAILILFLAEKASQGGMGFDETTAGEILAIYGSMVYLCGIPGGWIADKILGLRRAVFVGGVLIMFGHICLAIPGVATFYSGLGFIVLGTGLLKPNISAIVGKLYAADDPRRDAGFTVFYMGINIGAFLSPLVCGFLAEHPAFRSLLESMGFSPYSSWHFGFGAAAVGMAFGLVQYVLGSRRMGEAGLHPVPVVDQADARRRRTTLAAILGVVFGIPAIIAIIGITGIADITISRIANVLGVVLTLIVIGVFGGLFLLGDFTREERRRLIVVMVLFFGYAVFASIFEQAASTLSLFAVQYTELELFGFTFPASWFQFVNPLCIIVLAPIFAWLWIRLGPREPSAPTKFGIAMILVMGGFLIMVPAAGAAQTGVLVSPLWLIMLYFLHTCGELCLSPVGLSSMTRLAPSSISGMVMGIWFLGSSVGYYLAGRATFLYEKFSDDLPKFFLVMCILPAVAAVGFFVSVGPIRRMLARSAAEKAATVSAD